MNEASFESKIGTNVLICVENHVILNAMPRGLCVRFAMRKLMNQMIQICRI